MSLPLPEDAVTEAISASTAAVIDLREALVAAGIVLPSLSIDLVSCTSFRTPRPLVDLGRCRLDTARALAATLRKAAPR